MEKHVKAVRVFACLLAAVTFTVSATDRSLARLLASNFRSHDQSPGRVSASVSFSCAGVQGNYVWEQSADRATGYFRVRLARVEVNARSLPMPALSRINGVLAGAAMLRSSFVSCSGRYVDIQLDLHRIGSPQAVPLKTVNTSYVVELKGDELLDVRTLPDP